MGLWRIIEDRVFLSACGGSFQGGTHEHKHDRSPAEFEGVYWRTSRRQTLRNIPDIVFFTRSRRYFSICCNPCAASDVKHHLVALMVTNCVSMSVENGGASFFVSVFERSDGWTKNDMFQMIRLLTSVFKWQGGAQCVFCECIICVWENVVLVKIFVCFGTDVFCGKEFVAFCPVAWDFDFWQELFRMSVWSHLSCGRWVRLPQVNIHKLDVSGLSRERVNVVRGQRDLQNSFSVSSNWRDVHVISSVTTRRIVSPVAPYVTPSRTSLRLRGLRKPWLENVRRGAETCGDCPVQRGQPGQAQLSWEQCVRHG